MKDERTLAQLAQEALTVQDACNLSGVVHGWSRSISRLRELPARTKSTATRLVRCGHTRSTK
jgi:hypothetical protein